MNLSRRNNPLSAPTMTCRVAAVVAVVRNVCARGITVRSYGDDGRQGNGLDGRPIQQLDVRHGWNVGKLVRGYGRNACCFARRHGRWLLHGIDGAGARIWFSRCIGHVDAN